MASRSVKVFFEGNSTNLERAFDRVNKKAKEFNKSSSASQIGRGVLSTTGGKGSFLFGSAAFIGAAAAATTLETTVKAASDLNEEVSKTKVVFGESSKSVLQWSKDLATSFGLAQQQALQASGIFGAFFRNAGQGAEQASLMAKKFTELAADLASFNNTSVDDALVALRSGLSGEIEPLRRYQVFLTAAATQQEAMRETGKRSAKQLTEGEKIIARYNLILSQTARAQGDFARTSNGFANQQRILAAQTKNLEATLGTKLLPTMVVLIQNLNDGITAASGLGNALRQLDQDSGGFFGKLRKDLSGNPWGEMTAFVKVLSQGKPIKFGEAPSQTLQTLNNIKAMKKALEETTAQAKQFSDAFGLGALTTSQGLLTRPDEGTRGAEPPPPPPKKKSAKELAAEAAERQRKVNLGNTIFDNAINRRLDRVQDIPGLKGQIAALQGIRATIEVQIAKTKDDTRRLNLGDEIASIDRDIRGLNDQIKQNVLDAAMKARDAKKKLADSLKQQADDIKNAVLNELDDRQQRVQNKRALEDAIANFKQVKQLGSQGAIKLALRDVVDARAAVKRQNIADTPFRVSEGPKGPTNTLTVGNVTININSNQDPSKIADEVLNRINKKGRHGTHQSRGTIASRNSNVGIG